MTRSLKSLCVFFVLLITGCAGRASTEFSYMPPAMEHNKAEHASLPGMQESMTVRASVAHTKNAVMAYFKQRFPSAPPPQFEGNTVRFSVSLPQAEVALDCGELTTFSPAAQKQPQRFSALAAEAVFPLADGTSVPKPAKRTVTVSANIDLLLTPEGKNQTRLTLKVAYVVQTRLRYYAMISGFSPMMPYKLSEARTEEDTISFKTDEIGLCSSSKPAGLSRVSGAWPVQCVSKGVFEKAMLQEITAKL